MKTVKALMSVLSQSPATYHEGIIREWAEEIIMECASAVDLLVENHENTEPDIVPEYECGEDTVIPNYASIIAIKEML